MTWAVELEKIRRMLRDPDGTIWSDAYLRHLYNDAQQDFQNKTRALEDIHAQRIPGLYQISYQYDWEYRSLSTYSQIYQCLTTHDEYVVCHAWEPQQIAGIDADVVDYGIHFSHPWESCMSEVPGELIKTRFPNNFGTLSYMAYNNEPIAAGSKKRVQSADASYITTEGQPFLYYMYDDEDNSFVLYPRPSTVFQSDISGDGVAFFAEGDEEDTATGIIAVRTSTTDSQEEGFSVDIVDTDYNVFMVYSVSPEDVEVESDEPEFPMFMRKYVRFNVIARAYGGNNDGKIRSLSEYWSTRYELGIKFVKRYLQNKRQDRDYRLTSGPNQRRYARHVRLPDTYPLV